MDLSVVICTRNRARQLRDTLAAMTRLAIPVGTVWEVVVVDNGSTDDTTEVVAAWRDALPVRRVFQPVPGLSNARNAGIDAAVGRYIVWTDDDIAVDANWLSAYLAAFRRWPEAAVFGGRIVPLLQPPTPVWFARAVGDLADLLGVRDFGPQPVLLNVAADRLPFGGNYAIRAAEQRQRRYDPSLGIAPGRRTGGEEVAVIRTILQGGGTGWWVPDAIVEHIIPPQNQTTDYVISYYEAAGAAAGGAAMAIDFGVKLPLAFLRLCLARWLRQRSWVRCLVRYSYWSGRFKYRLAADSSH